MRGTNDGPFLTIGSSHKRVQVPFSALHRFQANGKVTPRRKKKKKKKARSKEQSEGSRREAKNPKRNTHKESNRQRKGKE